MNILTIIGNGFDLGHGLPTSFDAFIQSNPSVYPKKYATFRGGDGTWTRVEWDYGKQLCKILAERSWHDVTEVVEQIISDYGLNEYGEVDYFGFSSDAFEDEYQAIHFRVDLLSDFEKDFQQYRLDKRLHFPFLKKGAVPSATNCPPDYNCTLIISYRTGGNNQLGPQEKAHQQFRYSAARNRAHRPVHSP